MKRLGDAAERVVETYLLAQGLRMVARNWRSRYGEIDLICADAGTLVFVEVRSRRVSRFGSAAESITAHKQARLVATAQAYLGSLKRVPPCRFDAVLLDGDTAAQWLKNVIEI